MKKTIEVYDTTCRDGGQDPEINLNVSGKSKIIHLLDDWGADFIEVGYALGNKDEDILYKENLKNSKLVAFGSTIHPKSLDTPEDDPGIKAILNTSAGFATIFGKTWKAHVIEQLKTTPEINLKLIRSSVKCLVEKGVDVIYDAEHFFSGYDDDPQYAFKTIEAAIKGGAKRIVLCDTKGGCTPEIVKGAAQDLLKAFDGEKNVIWGFHGHDDTGCAVANTLEFVKEILDQREIVHVQGTFNGYGERTGNAPINIICANLEFKMNQHLPQINFKSLTSTSNEIAHIAGKFLGPQTPYVGRYAFAHKAGVHIHGSRSGATYNHISPEDVGNEERYLISNQSGRDAIVWFMNKYGYTADKQDPKVRFILEAAKNIATNGYDLNISDAVAELFLWDYLEKKERIIGIEEYVTSSLKAKRTKLGVTIIKKGDILDASGEQISIKETSMKSEGGPVDSQFKAIRKVLTQIYPASENVKMDFFLLDIPPIKNGAKDYSSSKALTIIGFTDGDMRWTTIGLDANRDVASFEAITNGFEYYIRKKNIKNPHART